MTNNQLVSQTRNQLAACLHSPFDAACVGVFLKPIRACRFGANRPRDICQFWPIVGPGSANIVICHRDWSFPGLVVQSHPMTVKVVEMNLYKSVELLTKRVIKKEMM